EATMNSIIGPLEQPRLAVDRVLVADGLQTRWARIELASRNDDRCRDVILRLQLHRANEILTELESPPALRGEQAHPEIGTDELAAERLQLMAWETVDGIHSEHVAPVPKSLLRGETLDDKNNRIDIVGK